METRRQITSKSETYPESGHVDEAVMNGEVSAQYPGRSPRLPRGLPRSRDSGKASEKSAEGIVQCDDALEGPKER